MPRCTPAQLRGHGTARRSAVSTMVPSLPFVPSLVVAGHPRHQFLFVARTNVLEEVISSASPQNRSPGAVVLDDHFTVLPSSP